MICDNCIHNAVCEREHFENHCGYKHTEADVIVPEFEKIKAEIKDYCEWCDNAHYQSTKGIMLIFDKHIKELKGENK